MSRSFRMSQSTAVTICLAAFALLLFIYSFRGQQEETQSIRSFRPHSSDSLPSPLAAPPQVVAPVENGPKGAATAAEKSRVDAGPGAEPAVAAAAAVSASFAAMKKTEKTRAMDDPSATTRLLTAAFYRKQAQERKSMFEAALKKNSTPSVSDVLLPIVEEVHCPSLVRVGAVGDGGKWMCNPWAMPKGGVVFSLGSYSEISFETDFQEATAKAATILTVDMKAANKEALAGLAKINGTFVHAMIAPKTNLTQKPPHYTVADLMAKQGHKHIEILKMDIEGSEVTVLPQFLNGNSVCQIMVEIHAIKNVPKLLREVANGGFLLQKYELNAFSTGSGLAEYSFIHESCLEKYGATLLASYLRK